MSEEIERDDEAFGRPINGDIPRYTSGAPKQHHPSELLVALDSVLDYEGVYGVRWQQHTPYFNDGEACEFGTYFLGVFLTPEGLETNEDEEYDEEDDENLVRPYSIKDKKLKKLVENLENAIERGHHYTFLNAKFGDPSRVTATKEGFSVEEFSHD